MKVNPGSASNHALFTFQEVFMDTLSAHVLIDSYDLDNCAVILAAYAPDLYDQLRTAANSGIAADALLSLARSLAKQAYDREKNLQ